MNERQLTKCTTANGRFGIMAAAAPQKRQCKLAREYPAGSVVEAATSRSHRSLAASVESVVRKAKLNIWDNVVARPAKPLEQGKNK